jgi:hypothetical protein
MKTTTNIIYTAFAWFALALQAGATCQEGCLTNFNTALGDAALINNTGASNTAMGFNALFSNTSGHSNTAHGVDALYSNTTGYQNIAVGGALYSNTTGSDNIAIGYSALYSNDSGGGNIAIGSFALYFNTGIGNTACGYNAFSFNTTGSGNTACGYNALGNTGGDNNIALGNSAGSSVSSGSNNIEIGNVGVTGDSKTIRIGTKQIHRNTYVAAISGVTVPGGVSVIVDANGHLGTITSSARFKDAIQPMDKASEAILALKPVTFRYKHELDPNGIPQFGLVAEDVQKVNPDLVARDEQGKPYTVRYEAVNAMLLNEFLKEHRIVEEQGATIKRQRKDFEAAIAQQQKQIEALTAGLQKVSAQLELTKAAPQITAINQ